MFALPLDNPLWLKLDDAHRDRDIPALLASLSETWDRESASSLFWDCLCHQDSCYGATYAAIPYLLTISDQSNDPQAKEEIAFFLGYVALVALEHLGPGEVAPKGLPDDVAGWTGKSKVYKNLAEYARRDLSDPNYPENLRSALVRPNEETAATFDFISEFLDDLGSKDAVEIPNLTRAHREDELAHYEEVLNRPPVTLEDLALVEKIRAGFFAALSEISRLSADAYLAADKGVFFLGGVAAAMGELRLARLIAHGENGGFQCRECGAIYAYSLEGGQMGGYLEHDVDNDRDTSDLGGKDPQVQDWEDGTLDRASVMIRPSETPSSKTVQSIIRLAEEKGDLQSAKLVRLFAGTFDCAACGKTSPVI